MTVRGGAIREAVKAARASSSQAGGGESLRDSLRVRDASDLYFSPVLHQVEGAVVSLLAVVGTARGHGGERSSSASSTANIASHSSPADLSCIIGSIDPEGKK